MIDKPTVVCTKLWNPHCIEFAFNCDVASYFYAPFRYPLRIEDRQGNVDTWLKIGERGQRIAEAVLEVDGVEEITLSTYSFRVNVAKLFNVDCIREEILDAACGVFEVARSDILVQDESAPVADGED